MLNIADRFGGTVRVRKKYAKNERTAYEWTVYGVHAVRLTKRVHPHLHEKREQADLLVQIYRAAPKSARKRRLIADLKSLKKIDYIPEEETELGEEDATD